MDMLFLALAIGLPLIRFVLFPARAMGRGGNWTIIGAVLIVGIMMALWLGVAALTAPAGDGTGPAVARAGDPAAGQLPDIAALARLL